MKFCTEGNPAPVGISSALGESNNVPSTLVDQSARLLMQLVSWNHLGMRTGRLMGHSCPSFLWLVLFMCGTTVMLAHCFKEGLRPASLLADIPEVSPSKCDGIGVGLFHKLEKICQDCGNLYQSDEVTGICRFNCFHSEGFAFCLKTLYVDENDSEQLVSLVEDRQSDLLLH